MQFAAIEGLSVDSLDVPRERFLTASEAWFRIKDAPEIASRFGVAGLDLGGAWFVAGSLLRDMAALRKLELKPWDYWGPSENLSRVSAKWSQEARETFDQLASRLGHADLDGEGEPKALADCPLPERVISFPHGEPLAVVLRQS